MPHSEPPPAARRSRVAPQGKPPGFLRITLALGALVCLCLAACSRQPTSRSRDSFAEISSQVAGKTAAEVVASLGEPDSKQKVFLADEKWIWWNFTFLDGNDIPPESRGQVVHLTIRFRNPSKLWGDPQPHSRWPVAEPHGVDYLLAGENP